MKCRPILMSAPMVRGTLRDTEPKTQTRRLIKDASDVFAVGMGEPVVCPYGQPGDRLWVRETWGLHLHGDFTYWCRDSVSGRGAEELLASWEIAYAADATSTYDHWRPSIFMPRWASRITLEITDVRVERLQDISEADAIAEGVDRLPDDDGWRDYLGKCGGYKNAVVSYRSLWESINGPGSWAANPWVWVIGYRRVTT